MPNIVCYWLWVAGGLLLRIPARLRARSAVYLTLTIDRCNVRQISWL